MLSELVFRTGDVLAGAAVVSVLLGILVSAARTLPVRQGSGRRFAETFVATLVSFWLIVLVLWWSGRRTGVGRPANSNGMHSHA